MPPEIHGPWPAASAGRPRRFQSGSAPLPDAEHRESPCQEFRKLAHGWPGSERLKRSIFVANKLGELEGGRAYRGTGKYIAPQA